MESGIYALYNIASGKAYIGQTRNLERRKQDHFRNLRKGKHYNKYLQRAFNQDGEQNFKFVIIEKCPIEELDKKERYYIEKYQLMDNYLGYNMENGGNVGKEISELAREAKRGEKNPMYGKKLSASHVEAIRIKNRCHGSSLRKEQVEKIKLDLISNVSEEELSNKYQVSKHVICKIKTGKNFSWVRPELNEKISENYKKKIRNEKIIDLYGKGFTRAEISKELKIMPSTVARVLKKPSRYFKRSEEKQQLINAVVADFEKGLTKEEIMKKYNISSASYVSYTHDAYNKRLQELKNKAIEMRKSGMMVKDIAKALGYARTTITKWTLTSCEYRDNHTK